MTHVRVMISEFAGNARCKSTSTVKMVRQNAAR